MRKQIFAVLAVIGLAATQVAAEPTMPKGGTKPLTFGKKRPIGNGQFQEASIQAVWMYYNEKLMRNPVLNERASSVQRGQFPDGGIEIQSGDVYLNVSIDSSGKILGCRVSKPAANPAITGHACPHFMKYARFYPALGKDGLPKAVSGDFHVYYNVEVTGKGVPAQPLIVASMRQIPNGRNASPKEEIVPENLGLTVAGLRKADGKKVSIHLDVDKQGNVNRCYFDFDSATFNNELDKTICQRGSALKFDPAEDSKGHALDDMYIFSVSLDKNGKWHRQPYGF